MNKNVKTKADEDEWQVTVRGKIKGGVENI